MPYTQKTTRRWLSAFAWGLLLLCTALHYLTDAHAVEFHNAYRRLYYLPILILSFLHGRRGGLLAAVLATLFYLPHAFFGEHQDPSPTVDKVAEIALYLIMGGLTGWLVEGQDRALRALERSLEERNAMERQLVRAGRLSALGQMTSGLAHEIRNPLASILGCAELLAAEFPPEHRKHRMSELLLKEIQRLRKVVDEFLRFARPQPPGIKALDARTLVEDVRRLTHPQAEEARVEVHNAIPEAFELRGDADQLSQVFLNLLLNAYQAFLESEQVGPRSVVLLQRFNTVGSVRYAALGVRDNGPGVSTERLEEVFNPYFTTREKGTGLGLSISNRIVEAHGGFIEVESVPGETTFWVHVPLEVAE